MTSRRSTYSNFDDPLGLVVRMLRSGDRTARSALFREISALILTPLDLLLHPREAHRIRSAQNSILPLVLIVGAPRAGTTLVYQILARYLPVTYFTNLSALFPRSPLTASQLFQRGSLTGRIALHSYYGNTAGLAGPNDGFHIWNRWLGMDRYRAPASLSDGAIAEMRQFFSAWTETFGSPLLNKNNRNADCVALLGRVLPEAFFVVVRRDPIYVAQSLLIARQHIQGNKRRRWGLRSLDQQDAGDPLGYVDSVCRQIVEIERKLADDCGTLPEARFIDLQYERFCEDPAATIGEISKRVWGTSFDATVVQRELHSTLRSTNRRRVTVQEFERIQARLAEGHRSLRG